MKTRKIYIAGPMTGLPGFNYAAFGKAAAKLRAEGIWEVVSPAEIGNQYGAPETINADPKLLAAVVAAETHALAKCEAIYLLPCWNKSVGARRELAQAIENGAEIVLDYSAPEYEADHGALFVKVDPEISRYIETALPHMMERLKKCEERRDCYVATRDAAQIEVDKETERAERFSRGINAAKEYIRCKRMVDEERTKANLRDISGKVEKLPGAK